MQVIKGRNVNQIFPELMHQLEINGREEDTRNGKVLRMPTPVTVVYEQPCERVLFSPARDANPFFHLMESIWMLAGYNDLAFPASIVSSMANFSDDGVILQGAYGYRWVRHFGINQLATIAQALRKNHHCRRQVLQMWDARNDLGLNSKDLPCNTQIYFSVNDGKLDMMVTNRSNDAVWGALGANAVHMSMLQELMALWVEVPVGVYYQVSNNMHIYEQHWPLMKQCSALAFPSQQYKQEDPYESGTTYMPLLTITGPGKIEGWIDDAEFTASEHETPLGLNTKFFRKVVGPMLRSIQTYKTTKHVTRSQNELAAMPSGLDWQVAGWEWLERRRKNGKNLSNLSR